jgi:CRISPR-associated exonuclease Cas4
MWAPDADNAATRIALSAIEHYAYCPRQAALIHVDGTWTDDVRTTLGDEAHRSVHSPGSPLPPPPSGVRRLTGLPVWSQRLRLYGICDVVEVSASTAAIPIEYKIGKYHAGGPADIQVAAQVLCLNEMLGQAATHGYVYSYTERHRHLVQLTGGLIETCLPWIGTSPGAAERLVTPQPLGDWDA